MLTYYLKTFGCQMNEEESLRIRDFLGGFKIKENSKPTDADIIIINTCSIRQTAEDRLTGLIDSIRTGQKGKTAKIAVTGCIAGLALDQYKRYQLSKSLLRKLNTVDLFFTAEEVDKLASLLPEVYSEENYYNLKHTVSPISAFVPIMKGCDNYCSFCIVPFSKGPERSIPAPEILQEIQKLTDQGIKEVLLLGQKINSYELEGEKRTLWAKKKLKDPQTPHPLTTLLEKIQEKTKLERIFFMTSYPTDFTDDLIEAIRVLPKVGEYIHIPVQSGSTKILKSMQRRYSRPQLDDLLDKIVSQLPNLHLSTDFIVGFPGETEVDFTKSKELLEKYPFDMAYIAPYSPRPGTTSASMIDDIPRKEKKDRWAELTKILEQSALQQNKQYLGKKGTVLIGRKKRTVAMGRLPNYKEVEIHDPSVNIGDIVPVEIITTDAWRLVGAILGRPTVLPGQAGIHS